MNTKKMAEIIKNAREQNNISQRTLAKKINVNHGLISKIEKGEIKKPSIEILSKLSTELKIDFYELIKYANYTIEDISNFYEALHRVQMEQKISSILKKKSVKKYIINHEAGTFLDIEKILNDYKKDNISLKEAIQLIDLCNPLYLNGTNHYFTKNQIYSFKQEY